MAGETMGGAKAENIAAIAHDREASEGAQLRGAFRCSLATPAVKVPAAAGVVTGPHRPIAIAVQGKPITVPQPFGELMAVVAIETGPTQKPHRSIGGLAGSH